MKKNIYVILILILILAIILGAQWGWKKRQAYLKTLEPMPVILTNTPEVEGKSQTPPGLPKDLPVETKDVVESATTKFPTQENTVQSSFTYRTSAEIETRYLEYKTYLEKNGYTLKESEANGVKVIQGKKEGEKITIALSIWENLTVVQISYLTF